MQAMVVEPSQTYRKLISTALTMHGYSCSEVSTGTELLLLLEQSLPRLIVLSGGITDLPVEELIAQIRLDYDSPTLAILVLSSRDDPSLKERLLNSGANSFYLKKNFDQFEQSIHQLSSETHSEELVSGRILYVEDTISVARVTEKLLMNKGHSVLHFDSAEAAYEAFCSQDFDLVLTDLNLAGALSGLNLLRRIRANDDTSRANTPVIVISSYSDDSKRVQLFHAGASDYVAKPVLEEELLARVKIQIRNRQLVDQISKNQAYLEKLAHKDQLTGLYNRHYLFEAAESLLAQAQRHNHPLSLILLDADHFKQVNDNHGHSTGDDVLIAIANILLSQSRKGDVVARFGGEELVYIAPYCNAEQAVKKADELRQLVQEAKPKGLLITASFGVAQWQQEESFAELFDRADKAVYLAKDAGRNRVVIL